MNREELIKEVNKYFKLSELVCPHCIKSFGNNAWQFLSTELLSTIYILRTKVVNKPMIVNTASGSLTQRGLRCNICQLCRNKTSKNRIYMSAHNLGKAIDFTVNGVPAEQIRDMIRSNINEFEYPIRIEKDVNWVHVDTYTTDNKTKLVEFSA